MTHRDLDLARSELVKLIKNSKNAEIIHICVILNELVAVLDQAIDEPKEIE